MALVGSEHCNWSLKDRRKLSMLAYLPIVKADLEEGLERKIYR